MIYLSTLLQKHNANYPFITDAIDYSKGLAEKEDVDNTISSVIDEKKGN